MAKQVDVVGVFDKDFNQVLVDARPVKCTVKEDSKVMEHPLETGASIVDHKIILPIEIELSVVIQSEKYKDVYDQIKKRFLDSELFSIQTKTGVYNSMVIQSMPHDESPEMFDTVGVAIRFKEVKLVTATFGKLPPKKVKKKKNSDTTKKGEQQGATKTSNQSVLSRVFK